MKKIIALFFPLFYLSSFAKTIYVNGNASGLNNGSSWVNAYLSLQNALSAATSGDSVKVATGVYIPTTGTNQTISFVLKRGVTMLGGFPAVGNPSDAQRDWANNPTTLSAILTVPYRSYTLVTAQNLDTATVFDGFVLKNAVGAGSGSGIHIVNSIGLAVKNVVFENNIYDAIKIIGSTVVFSNCALNANNVGGIGRTIYNSANSNTSFYNCVISGNTGDAGSSSATIVNDGATLNLINCSIVNNTGNAFYGTGGGAVNIQNSIFWNNRTPGNKFEDNDIVLAGQTITISHSLTQTYFDKNTPTLLVNINPRFFNISKPAGADGKFFTADDGLQLTAPCSPALNSGDNSFLTNITTDLAGNPRIFNGGTVDLGAYEIQNTPGIPQKTVFVNNAAGNTGTNDGSSWQNAYKTLQQALLYCADTIKMAAGVYLSDNSYVDSVFTLENKKVILGGYPSTGNPTDAARNPAVYHTILKGNYTKTSTGQYYPLLKCYNNDSTTVIDGLSFSNESNNSGGGGDYPAVSISYGSKLKVLNCDLTVSAANNIKSSGIMISKAAAPYIYRSKFNTYYHDVLGGGAIQCSDSANPTIAYCDFEGTRATATARAGGGALYFTNCSGTIDSCVFWNDLQSVNGTMVNSNNSKLIINNCMFRNTGNTVNLLRSTNNSASQVTGSVFRNMYISGDPPAAVYNDNSSPVFTKCLFDSSDLNIENMNRSAPIFNNCVSAYGRFMKSTYSFPSVNNCTIVNVYRSNTIGNNLSEQELVINYDSSVLRANNTIFWTNKLAASRKDINDSVSYGNPSHNSISYLSNCITRNYGVQGVNGNKVGLDPRFYQLSDINGPDNKLFTADDGIRLAPCSPAINAGNNTLPNILPTDVLQNTRIANTTIDMGAYESTVNSNTSGSYYVNASATGANNGTSWQDAYTEVQVAVCNACADTIRVAAGTYKPAVAVRDSGFVINHAITMYGGYPAFGPQDDQSRAPFDNPTILSGNIGNPNDSLDNTTTLISIIAAPDSVTIDGFIVKDAYSVAGGIGINASGGAGLYTYYSNVYIKNCQFINNKAIFYGGAMSIGYLASSTILNTIFSGNASTNSGGAIYAAGNSIKISGCVFENNYSWGEGGAVRIYQGSTFDINNSVFYRNYTTATNQSGVGGALHTYDGRGTIYNCSFLENSASYPSTLSGGGICFKQSLSTFVRNCVFKGNTSGGSTTALGADMDWNSYNTVSNCVLQVARPFTTGFIVGDPAFINSANPKGPDGKWFTADDGLQLDFSSPAINVGTNTVVGIPLDIAGNPRIVNTTVDEGAYEYQDQPVAHAGADTSICTGTSTQIGVPANPSHIYSWTSNPAGFSSTAVTPTVSPTVPTVYFLEVHNGSAVAKDTVMVSPVSTLTSSITITTTASAICQGSTAGFTATPINGGATPVYQWQVNGVNAGTNSPIFTTSALTNGSQVKAILNSSASCASPATATSNIIPITVNPVLTAGVSVLASATNICTGDNVIFTASPVNGGTAPSYQWIKGGLAVGTGNTYNNSNLSTGDAVYVVLTSNGVCVSPATASSSPIVITVNPTVTPSVSVVSSATGICQGAFVTFTAQPVNNGNTPFYQWKRNGGNVGTNSTIFNTNALADGDVVSVVLTSNAVCASPLIATSNNVPVTVYTGLVPAVNITGTTTVDMGKSSVLTATSNSHNTPGYQWQDSTNTHSWQSIGGATASTVSYKPALTGDKVRCMLTSHDTCASPATVVSQSLVFTVNTVTAINPVPAADYGIKCFPDPAVSILIIEGLKISDHWQTLEITGMDGAQKMVLNDISNQTSLNIRVDKLASGLYIALLKRKSGTVVYLKFIKL